jgi:hypothetical protein
MDTYTLAELESGAGRYTNGGTVVLQKGAENVFTTEPDCPGWTVAPGWHVAGGCESLGAQWKWTDLR